MLTGLRGVPTAIRSSVSTRATNLQARCTCCLRNSARMAWAKRSLVVSSLRLRCRAEETGHSPQARYRCACDDVLTEEGSHVFPFPSVRARAGARMSCPQLAGIPQWRRSLQVSPRFFFRLQANRGGALCNRCFPGSQQAFIDTRWSRSSSIGVSPGLLPARVVCDSRQASSIRPSECSRAQRAASRQALPRG